MGESSAVSTRNQLHFGDNLDVLRSGIIPSGSVDLIYLDPPFNSAANYNMLFREPEGFRSQAQIEAFEDTWTWSIESEAAYDDVLNGDNTRLASLLHALKGAIGDNSLMAYLAMMAVRLVEMHRVLKKTGSLYLHCDATASHYLKLVLDSIFDPRNFRNEIIWKRTGVHGDSKTWSRVSDTILFYSKSEKFTWNTPHDSHADSYVASHYNQVDGEGRRYQLTSLLSPSLRPNMVYELNGFRSPPMGWRYSRERMTALDEAGLIHYPTKKDGSLDFSKRPRFKRYLDEQKGPVITTIWSDIPPLNSQSQERLGYPTQKPVALLERILAASSNPGDVVLDPFCGCGTTIHAAQRMGRAWVGIDITHLAVSLIESRIVSAFPNIQYELYGTPKDLAGAKALAARNKHQFEWWALSLVRARPANDKKKGADHGVDGVLWVRTGLRDRAKVVVSVKGGYNVSVPMIRDLIGVIEREQAAVGLFVTLVEPTGPMKVEAAKAGFYTVDGERYPRVQILSIEQLLGGAKPDLPLIDVAVQQRMARVDAPREEQRALF